MYYIFWWLLHIILNSIQKTKFSSFLNDLELKSYKFLQWIVADNILSTTLLVLLYLVVSFSVWNLRGIRFYPRITGDNAWFHPGWMDHPRTPCTHTFIPIDNWAEKEQTFFLSVMTCFLGSVKKLEDLKETHLREHVGELNKEPWSCKTPKATCCTTWGWPSKFCCFSCPLVWTGLHEPDLYQPDLFDQLFTIPQIMYLFVSSSLKFIILIFPHLTYFILLLVTVSSVLYLSYIR